MLCIRFPITMGMNTFRIFKYRIVEYRQSRLTEVLTKISLEFSEKLGTNLVAAVSLDSPQHALLVVMLQ